MVKKHYKIRCACVRENKEVLSKKKRPLITGNRKHEKIDHKIDLSVSDYKIAKVS